MQWKWWLVLIVLLLSAVCIAPAAAVTPDVLFDGTVTLGAGNFTLSASGETYAVANLTPFGALEAAANTAGFTYVANLKMGKLVLDDVSTHAYEKHVAGWECRVNGNLLDYWGSYDTEGYPNYPLKVGDEVVFLYGPDGTVENATAFVNITVSEDPSAGKDVLYDGAVTLDNGTFSLTASGETYAVANLTPFGALEAAANTAGFTYVANLNQGRIVLDDVSTYAYEKHVAGWECRVNGKLLDYWGSYDTEGYPNYPLKDGDEVVFLYGPDGTVENATAVIAIDVHAAAAPGDWTISLTGACSATVTKAEFEEALACTGHDHTASWTDPATGDVWAGMPLWMLVAMVDDEETGDHYTFNDALAAEGYSVKITSKDGYNVNIPSADMARNSGFIVANTLNGSALPETIGEKNKPCWPLQLKGVNASAGQLVGGIASIELVGLPEPGEGWTLKVCGVVNDTITQAEFEEGEACHGSVNYTDSNGVVWTGVPLWYLVGVSDNIETTDHWTFDDTLAATNNYTIKVIASDGWSQSYGSAQVARSNGYILANLMNGQPIPETDKSYPVKLVGDNVSKKVKSVAEIDLVDLIPGPAPEGSWNLDLNGRIGYTVTEDFFEQAVACSHHTTTWTNPETGETWGGIALWELCGFVDDRIPHGSNGFNDAEATAGYTVIVTAADGYSKEFSSKDIARNNNYIVANTCNGTPLSKDGNHPPWPLRLVGPAVSGSNSVGAIASIELTDFLEPTEIPEVHIIKYDADGTTVLAERTVNYTWMEENLKVYGDGETVYRFQGPTFDPDDLWNPAEDINIDPGKVYGAVKGTAVRDLCDLVGGMDPGTEITLEASDGYQTKMNYTNIYTPLDRQGTAVLAWYKQDEGYVPDYGNGYRLYFITPDPDTIFGNDDMRASFAEKYWHYYFSGGVQYPSAGGLSARNIATIKIYQPEKDWNLTLEGTISADLSKAYFEEGMACEATHRAEYTDSKGRVWTGMPLWRLIGWVDDNNEHTGAAFNDTMAAEGYTIHVIASDGYEQTFTSQEVARNSNYILANTVNGSHIDPEDSAWPLKLVGTNVSKSVKSVVRIAFIPPGMDDAVQDIGTITAGSEKNFTIENCTFENLTLRASGDITGGEFAVSTVGSLPQGVPAPDSQVYQFVHVLYPQPQDTLGNATITFSVPLSWLSTQGIAATDVDLIRYHDDAWQQLPTIYLGSSGGLAYFTATTPGFSYFAVGGTVTPTPSPSPSYHTSSSGGGSSAISAVSGSIPAGESKTFAVTETAFSTIKVRAYDQISDLLLTVQAAPLPKNVTAPDGAVYELEKVTLYRTDQSAIDGVVITFAVDTEWLKEHGVSTGDVSLMRYVNGQWTRLDTTFVEEKDGKAYYSAESPGFSLFAITGTEDTAVTPVETTAPVTGTTTEAQTGPATETQTTTATPSQQSPVGLAVSAFAVLIALLIRRR